MKRLILIALLAFLVLPALSAFAQRSLYWDSIDVRARLDEEGRLHVAEEQNYVFDGAWNGGERTFRVEPGQKLEFERISRRDASGNLVPLRSGSLSGVDEWDYVTPTQVRWRSRLESDPPFENTHLTYVLEYTLANVLQRSGNQYTLNHDFAFSDRAGDIRRLTVTLDLAPVWHGAPAEEHFAAGPLPPGQGFVVRRTLTYSGSGAPGARDAQWPLRGALIFITLVLPLFLWRRLVAHEREVGRLDPIDASHVTLRDVEQTLTGIPAEVAGATWDEDVGAPEVSALLARWTAEGKIRTTVAGKKELQMQLQVPRDTFADHERELIDGLFFDGNETSTSAIRKQYKDSGFNPTSMIKAGLQARMRELPDMNAPGPKISPLPSLVLFAIAVLALVWAKAPIPTIIVIAVAWIIGAIFAARWRSRLDFGLGYARATFAVTVAIAVLAAAWQIGLAFTTAFAAIGIAAAAWFAANQTFNSAKSRDGLGAIRFRKRLATIREYFIEELRKPTPALDDRWFPYVIAFGLEPQANKWMESFGGTTASTSSWTGSSSSSSSSSSPSWSGGGGAFGGAGATGSWGMAAAGIASGVASSSSSSGGGGGSSSGGGGGGGW